MRRERIYHSLFEMFHLQHLKYYTQIHVRSTRGKNARGHKITGIEPLQGEDKVNWKICHISNAKYLHGFWV